MRTTTISLILLLLASCGGGGRTTTSTAPGPSTIASSPDEIHARRVDHIWRRFQQLSDAKVDPYVKAYCTRNPKSLPKILGFWMVQELGQHTMMLRYPETWARIADERDRYNTIYGLSLRQACTIMMEASRQAKEPFVTREFFSKMLKGTEEQFAKIGRPMDMFDSSATQAFADTWANNYAGMVKNHTIPIIVARELARTSPVLYANPECCVADPFRATWTNADDKSQDPKVRYVYPKHWDVSTFAMNPSYKHKVFFPEATGVNVHLMVRIQPLDEPQSNADFVATIGHPDAKNVLTAEFPGGAVDAIEIVDRADGGKAALMRYHMPMGKVKKNSIKIIFNSRNGQYQLSLVCTVRASPDAASDAAFKRYEKLFRFLCTTFIEIQ